MWNTLVYILMVASSELRKVRIRRLIKMVWKKEKYHGWKSYYPSLSWALMTTTIRRRFETKPYKIMKVIHKFIDTSLKNKINFFSLEIFSACVILSILQEAEKQQQRIVLLLSTNITSFLSPFAFRLPSKSSYITTFSR